MSDFTVTLHAKGDPAVQAIIDALGTDQVPVQSPQPEYGYIPANDGKESYEGLYFWDRDRLTTEQQEALYVALAQRFSATVEEVKAEIASYEAKGKGLPIRLSNATLNN